MTTPVKLLSLILFTLLGFAAKAQDTTLYFTYTVDSNGFVDCSYFSVKYKPVLNEDKSELMILVDGFEEKYRYLYFKESASDYSDPDLYNGRVELSVDGDSFYVGNENGIYSFEILRFGMHGMIRMLLKLDTDFLPCSQHETYYSKNGELLFTRMLYFNR